MRRHSLVLRSVAHYRRTNAAVVIGVAVAVAVLAGALLVGHSVRASLRALAEARIGRTDAAVVGSRPFDASLAERLSGPGRATVAVLSLRGAVTEPSSGRRASPVEVWGVDARFWAFHGAAAPELGEREALLSPQLAEELGAGAGQTLLVRSEAAQAIPGSTLFGRRDDPARALRLRVKGVQAAAAQGEFSLRPRQGEARALFVPLATLQAAFGQPDRVNLVLARGGETQALAADLARRAELEDLGLRLRAIEPGRSWSLESDEALLADPLVAAGQTAAAASGLGASASLIYLANELRVRDAAVPYSLVAAVDERGWRAVACGAAACPDTKAPRRRADRAQRVDGARARREAGRRALARVLPLARGGPHRDAPSGLPGAGDRSDRGRRGRPRARARLPRHHARDAPRRLGPAVRGRPVPHPPAGRGLLAALPDDPEGVAAARRWARRSGATGWAGRRRSGWRSPPRARRAPTPPRPSAVSSPRASTPPTQGLVVDDVRTRTLAAAKGATDFGEYFVYFSFFLVVAALLLAGLFFRFGVEQRLAEVGLLRAVGFTEARLRRLFLAEAVLLSGVGAILGMAGAVAYAWLMMLGLRTVWVGAVGTRALALAVGPQELAVGALGGIAAALLAVWLTLRGLRGRSVRSLLTRAPSEWSGSRGMRRRRWAAALAAVAGLLLAAGATGGLHATGAFFGAGAALLGASLLLVAARLAGDRARAGIAGAASLRALGFRQAAFRPGRSVLAIALVAFAAFVIVSVGAFRHSGPPATGPKSETGGFSLLARSVLPIHHDPETPEGRAALGLDGVPELAGLRIERFRLAAGEDASCLNLYRPDRPAVIAPAAAFLREGRFEFQKSLAETSEERTNPWRLLAREAEGGAIPVIADANALEYVLHRRVGEVWTLGDSGVSVRVVGALRPGLLQGELVTSERHFLRAFPRAEGFRFFLIETPPGREAAAAGALESRLADFGFDAEPSAARLEAFHRVENTYIATFQTLGALGLLLGTLGIGAVLVRNAFEQRRELALLRAVGYRPGDVRTLVLAETALLLLLGLAIGSGAALVAILPALADRATLPALAPVLLLLVVVAGAGLVVSRLAAGVVLRLPLLESLRSE